MPTRWPLRSKSGPPEDPRDSGALCSMAPVRRLPPGPRKLACTAATKPKLVRTPRPPGWAAAMTASPGLTASSAQMAQGLHRRCRRSARPGHHRRHAGHGGSDPPPVGEGHHDLFAPEVVGVGGHRARGPPPHRFRCRPPRRPKTRPPPPTPRPHPPTAPVPMSPFRDSSFWAR